MTHAELVQVATDLISESQQPMNWLLYYDSALANSSDGELEGLVERLHREMQPGIRLAA